jgi:hypothetical protein
MAWSRAPRRHTVAAWRCISCAAERTRFGVARHPSAYCCIFNINAGPPSNHGAQDYTISITIFIIFEWLSWRTVCLSATIPPPTCTVSTIGVIAYCPARPPCPTPSANISPLRPRPSPHCRRNLVISTFPTDPPP